MNDKKYVKTQKIIFKEGNIGGNGFPKCSTTGKKKVFTFSHGF